MSHKRSQQHAYERFETVRLAADPALLKRFVFLWGAERVVPAHCDRHHYELLRASQTLGRELTHQFYALYADIRQKVLHQLCRTSISPMRTLRLAFRLFEHKPLSLMKRRGNIFANRKRLLKWNPASTA